RMNTVFKFHEDAWVLAGLAGGVGLALIGRFLWRARWIVAGCAAVFLMAGLVYPLTAIATRIHEVPPGGLTVDGLAFLSSDDRAAVRWLSDQSGPNGRIVIAEGVGEDYSTAAYMAHMATYSGAATVLAWSGHEVQWRGALPELGARQRDLAALYRDVPLQSIGPILDRYKIRLVVVGDAERTIYGDSV